MLTVLISAEEGLGHQEKSGTSGLLPLSREAMQALMGGRKFLRALWIFVVMCLLSPLLSSNSLAEFERTTRFFGPSRMTTSVVIDDFNRDGLSDLVAVNRDEGEANDDGLRLLLGTEKGQFQDPGQSISVRTDGLVESTGELRLISAVSGDFNQDNYPDLAVLAQASPGRILIFLGDGNGGFPLANRSVLLFGESVTPTAMAIGDFDQTGTPQLAVLANDKIFFFDGLSGNGLPRTAIELGNTSRSLAVGNLNADTIPDVAVAQDSSVSILLGRDSFEFESPLVIDQRTEIRPRSVAIEDMDQNGTQDILVAHDGTLSTASLYLGNGFGQFPDYMDIGSPTTTRNGPDSVAIGDFDKDGNPDFAVVNSNFERRNVTIFRGYSHSEDESYFGYSHLEFEPYDTIPATGLPKKIIEGEVDPNTGPNRDVRFDSEEDEVPYALYIEDLDEDEDLDLITANFSHNGIGLLTYDKGFEVSLAIDFRGSGAGRTDADPPQDDGGFICLSTIDCTLTYSLEQPPISVTLTATPFETNNQLSIFAGWSGCNSVSGNQCTVVMNSDQAVAVTFIAPVTVPNVSGQSQSAATAALQAAPLNFTVTTTQEASATVASGNAIRTEPAAGASVAPGTAINLVVSVGPGVNTFSDGADVNPGDQICETGSGNGDCTLRAAIQEANAQDGEQTIILTPGTYTLSLPGQNEDAAVIGDLDITDNLIIASSNGDPATVIISGNGLDRVFDIPQGSPNVTISGVTIQGGNIIGSTGGGIRNVAGTLTVENSVVTSNRSDGSGGGISHLNGTLVIRGTTVSNNTSQGRGGGVQAQDGTVTIEANSQFTGNQANFGGGLSTGNANVTVTNSSMTGNSANGGGGGVYKFLSPGDIIPGITAPTVRLEGTTLQGNLINDCEGFLIDGPNNTIGNTDRCNLQTP